jgi:hydrogenase maturation protease
VADAPGRSVLVVGVGNELRRDDGVGIAVARRLRAAGVPEGIEVREEHGEPIDLLDRWQDCDAVVLVDTMRSGAAPGTIRRLDASASPLPAELRRSPSTHAVSIAEAIERARALDQLPASLVVYAIEGRDFDAGAELSEDVEAVAADVADAVLREARALAARSHDVGIDARPAPAGRPAVSDDLDRWLHGGENATLGDLIELFGQKSFALVFVLLLGVPALPLPTGGATHVFELIAMLLALELIVGRRHVWLPQRWSRLGMAGAGRQRFLHGLLGMIRRLERISRPRLRFLFDHRLSNVVFGALALGGSAGAFLAPPFTGLDTLPALGVVLVSLGVLLEDIAIVVLGVTAGAAGIALEIVLGTAALHGLSSLL